MKYIILTIMTLNSFFAANVHADDEKTIRVQVSSTTSSDTFLPGSQALLTLKLMLIPGNHANSNRPKAQELIPTTFFPTKSELISWGRVKYPKPTEVIEWYSVEPISVFEDGAIIQVPFEISEEALAGEMVLSGKLRVQVCDDKMCYPKETLTTSTKIMVDSWD